MIGHRAARAYLERELPVAALLTGPASVGKWTLAAHLADHHRVRPVDRWAVPHGLTIDTVRLVTAYAHRAPMGEFKLILARLDDSSRPALNALLKTLEEPPPRVRFLLVSSMDTLPTVASRCMVFPLGRLTPGELEQVYRVKGMSPAKAERAARLARGQVERGYHVDSADTHKNQVVTLARALATGDPALYANAFRAWDARSSELLTTFFTECLTQRWAVFCESDTFGLHANRSRLWQMVTALGSLPAARPRLGVRAALEPFLGRP